MGQGKQVDQRQTHDIKIYLMYICQFYHCITSDSVRVSGSRDSGWNRRGKRMEESEMKTMEKNCTENS